MTKEQALLWVLGVVGSVCAGAVTLDKVLDIIHKYIKKAQAPDAAQNQRLTLSSNGWAQSKASRLSTQRP